MRCGKCCSNDSSRAASARIGDDIRAPEGLAGFEREIETLVSTLVE